MNNFSRVKEIRKVFSDLLTKPECATRVMPGYYYRDESIFELEKEKLFYSEWVCIGHESDIPEPGDFFSTRIIDEPIVVVRKKSLQIGVLSNVCRHRFTLLKTGKGNTSTFVCPYHNWTYDLEGHLRGAPYMDQVAAFDRGNCRLPVFNHEIWKGFIFVNIDGQATPLAPRLAGLEPLIQNYRMETMTSYFEEDVIWKYNWKAICENFMEGYHLSFLHKNSFGPDVPTELHEKFPCGDFYTGHKAHYAPHALVREPHSPDLTDEEKRYSVFFWVYPSMVVGLGPHGAAYLLVLPTNSLQSNVRWGFIAYNESSTVESNEKVFMKKMEEWKEGVIKGLEEDKALLARLMEGYTTNYATLGPYGPIALEGNIYEFHQYAAKKMCS